MSSEDVPARVVDEIVRDEIDRQLASDSITPAHRRLGAAIAGAAAATLTAGQLGALGRAYAQTGSGSIGPEGDALEDVYADEVLRDTDEYRLAKLAVAGDDIALDDSTTLAEHAVRVANDELQIGDGTDWQPAAVPIHDGTDWSEGRAYQWTGSSWQQIAGLEPAIPASVVDDFEDGDLSGWNGNTGNFTVVQSDPGEGDSALQKDGADGNHILYSLPGDGLDTYPSPGDSVSCLLRDTAGDIGNDDKQPLFVFGLENDGGTIKGYCVHFVVRSDQWLLLRVDDLENFDVTTLATGSGSLSGGNWYDVEVERNDGTMTVRVYEWDTSNKERGGQIGDDISATDDTYHNDEGVGIANWSTGNTGETIADFIRANPNQNAESHDFTSLTQESNSQIADRSDWQGRPVFEELNNGDWVLVYRDGSNHATHDAHLHIRFSDDEGATWTADDTLLDGSSVSGVPIDPSHDASDPIFFQAPNGDLLIHVAIDDNPNDTRHGTRQYRSTDGGASWTDEGKISWSGWDGIDDAILGGQDYFVHPDTGDIYVSLFIDPTANRSTPWKSGIARSTDGGASWEYLSDISTTDDGTNEIGIEYVGGDEIVVILRDDDNSVTYRATSSDLGSTWSSLETVMDGFAGTWDRARLYNDGNLTGGTYTDGPLWNVGRHRNGTNGDDWIAVTWSWDDGETWKGPVEFDSFEDCAYSDLLPRSDGSYYMATYGGSRPDGDLFEYIYSTV